MYGMWPRQILDNPTLKKLEHFPTSPIVFDEHASKYQNLLDVVCQVMSLIRCNATDIEDTLISQPNKRDCTYGGNSIVLEQVVELAEDIVTYSYCLVQMKVSIYCVN